MYWPGPRPGDRFHDDVRPIIIRLHQHKALLDQARRHIDSGGDDHCPEH
jgi:hypothetical protein